jgi:hypothetical protein
MLHNVYSLSNTIITYHSKQNDDTTFILSMKEGRCMNLGPFPSVGKKQQAFQELITKAVVQVGSPFYSPSEKEDYTLLFTNITLRNWLKDIAFLAELVFTNLLWWLSVPSAWSHLRRGRTTQGH